VSLPQSQEEARANSWWRFWKRRRSTYWATPGFNDVTARDLQRKDGQWTRAKSFDTFAPFGPWIAKIIG